MDKQTEDLLKFLGWFIASLAGVVIGWTKWLTSTNDIATKKLEKEERVAIEQAKQNSVGAEKVRELEEKISNAIRERTELRRELDQHKTETDHRFQIMTMHQLEEINDNLETIKKLNKNK